MTQHTSHSDPRFYTLAELRDIFRVSPRTIGTWIARGDIQSFTSGAIRLVERQALLDFIATHTRIARRLKHAPEAEAVVRRLIREELRLGIATPAQFLRLPSPFKTPISAAA